MRTYFGCFIEKTFPSGMYTALTPAGRVRADDLTGIKQMIRRAMNKPDRQRECIDCALRHASERIKALRQS